MTRHLPRSNRQHGGLDPLDLVATYVTNRSDIEFAERTSIAATARWAFGRRKVTTPTNLLTIDYADRIHRRMFGDVWKWAGRRRTQSDEHGIEPDLIEPELTKLFDRIWSWHHTGRHEPAERAIHLHDELVRIRAYRDGNVRHARLTADLYLHLVDAPRLTWTPLPTGDRSDDGTELTALQRALDQAARESDPAKLKSALDRALEPPR